MYTVVRFFKNPSYDPRAPRGPNSNPLISRTLGKICFVDAAYSGARPQDGEFWIADVTKETDSGQPRGCFLCEPFERVEYENLVPLTSAMCTVNLVYGYVLTVDPIETHTPELKTIPWILPLRQKSMLLTNREIVAIIVNLGGEFWSRW